MQNPGLSAPSSGPLLVTVPRDRPENSAVNTEMSHPDLPLGKALAPSCLFLNLGAATATKCHLTPGLALRADGTEIQRGGGMNVQPFLPNVGHRDGQYQPESSQRGWRGSGGPAFQFDSCLCPLLPPTLLFIGIDPNKYLARPILSRGLLPKHPIALRREAF